MKPASTKAIIYDDNCPMCSAYTKAFVKGGLISNENRIAFTKVNIKQFNIDWKRARHEIPVIDLDKGSVVYGVDALALVLGERFGLIKIVMRIKCVRYFFKRLYKLISYNRKIIAMSAPVYKNEYDCSPDFSFKWRYALAALMYSMSVVLFLQSFSLLDDLFAIRFSTLDLLFIYLWPFLLGSCMSVKLCADMHAHFSITVFMAAFLFFIAARVGFFLHLPGNYFIAVIAVILLATLIQLIKRVAILNKVYSSET